MGCVRRGMRAVLNHSDTFPDQRQWRCPKKNLVKNIFGKTFFWEILGFPWESSKIPRDSVESRGSPPGGGAPQRQHPRIFVYFYDFPRIFVGTNFCCLPPLDDSYGPNSFVFSTIELQSFHTTLHQAGTPIKSC